MVILKKNFEDALEFANNKVCIIRCDLNLPIIDGEVTDFTRLDKVLPTLKMLLARNSKILLISHLGRPKGKFDEQVAIYFLSSSYIPHRIIVAHRRSITTGNSDGNSVRESGTGSGPQHDL